MVLSEGTTVEKRIHGKARAASWTRIRLKQFSLEKINRKRRRRLLSEPKTDSSAKGKDGEGLPGSESVARAEGNTRNEGDPESPCRTNYEGQAGREAQRQEAPPDASGVGLAHSSQPQGASPEAGEGANSQRSPHRQPEP